jgi:hypothetical protein
MRNEFERQRKTIRKVAENRTRQLLEYGVPGMKWGVRNLPTRLDKIKGPENVKMAAQLAGGLSQKNAAGYSKAVALHVTSWRAGVASKKAWSSQGKLRLLALKTAAKKAGDKLVKATSVKPSQRNDGVNGFSKRAMGRLSKKQPSMGTPNFGTSSQFKMRGGRGGATKAYGRGENL